MGLEKLLKGLVVGVVSLHIGLLGNLLYTSSDFSNVRSEKHQRIPITRQIQDKKGEKYAVLLNADGDDYFKNYVEFAYNSLRRAGFSDENIYVLQSSENSEAYVDGKADRETLTRVFDELKQKTNSENMVLLYTTNHGGNEHLFFGESNISLDEKDMTSSEMRDLYDGVNSNYTLAIFKQCRGEGFADEFGRGNIIGLSAANDGKNAFKEDWDNNEGFTLHVFSAIGGENPFGKRVNADANSDGKVSIEEIFDFAAQNNPYTEPRWYGFGKETPQMYWQNANPKDLHIR